MYRILSTCLVVAFGIASVNQLAFADPLLPENSSITLERQTQVPGEILKPGKYSIQVVDHLSDRMIIRIEDVSGKRHVVFLAVPSKGTSASSAVGNGVILWSAQLDGKPALRGYKFPSGYTVEFVYPKSEAAVLAKSNQGTVLAVDPDSEGKPAVQHMSQDDLQMIHLWMLSLTTAGLDSKTPAILAQAYQRPASQPPAQIAANSIPPAPPATGRASRSPDQNSVPLQQNSRKHSVVAVLPHTASDFPLLLVALFGVFLAALLIHWGLSTFSSQKSQ